MRIGILADTHDKLPRTRSAVNLLAEAGAEILIHCGDLTGPDILAACAILPCYFVFGNNDADAVTDLSQAAAAVKATSLGWGDVVELAEKRVGVVHGHQPSDFRRVQRARPDYLLFGHSHIAVDQREGSMRAINPGALHRAEAYSVALLDLEADVLRFLRVPR